MNVKLHTIKRQIFGQKIVWTRYIFNRNSEKYYKPDIRIRRVFVQNKKLDSRRNNL